MPVSGGPADPDLQLAARAAVAGGRAALGFYGGASLAVDEKAAGDPVTEADRAANRAILALLAEHRPEDAVLSEESAPPPGPDRRNRLWVVDPLDGTKEFIARNGEFSVMVGLAVEGRARLGAVYRPDPGVLFLGAVDGSAEGGGGPDAGARRLEVDAEAADGELALDDAEPLRLRAPEPGDGPLRLAHSRSHWDEKIEILKQELHPVTMVPSGSVGVKCSLIASGRADLYVHPVPYLKEWDTCAPEAILRGAGGTVTDCRGTPLTYGKETPPQPGGLCAARPGLWPRVEDAVRSVAPE